MLFGICELKDGLKSINLASVLTRLQANKSCPAGKSLVGGQALIKEAFRQKWIETQNQPSDGQKHHLSRYQITVFSLPTGPCHLRFYLNRFGLSHTPDYPVRKKTHKRQSTSCSLVPCTAPVLQFQTAPHTPHHILYGASPSVSNSPTYPTPHPVQHQSFSIKQPHIPHTTSCTAPVLQYQTAPHTPHHILYSTSPSVSNSIPTHPTPHPVQHQSFSIKQPHTPHTTSCTAPVLQYQTAPHTPHHILYPVQHQSISIKQPHTPHTTSCSPVPCTAPVLQYQTAPHTPHHILYSTSPSVSNSSTHPTPHLVQHQSFSIKQPHTPHTTILYSTSPSVSNSPHTPHHILQSCPLYSTSPSVSNSPTHPTPHLLKDWCCTGDCRMWCGVCGAV